MNLAELLNHQHTFDESHGWALQDRRAQTLLTILNGDLIGLFGEIGEFANIIKKLNLERPHATDAEFDAAVSISKPLLADELIDVFIYVIRIATHLEINLEIEYLRKLAINTERFERFHNANKDE